MTTSGKFLTGEISKEIAEAGIAALEDCWDHDTESIVTGYDEDGESIWGRDSIKTLRSDAPAVIFRAMFAVAKEP